MVEKQDFLIDSSKLVDELTDLICVNFQDEQEKQVLGAYFFGMLNGLAQGKEITPIDIQAVMIRILNEKFGYSLESSVQFAQFLIDSTDKETHPTMFAIIHRGLNGYFMYCDKQIESLREDFNHIITLVKEED
ncbi:hypothetical protein HCJ66_01445 [Listeria sp. FSL L7-1582]|uniref:Imm48 family immunity protein n=1 Tax=Listeria portnoyi TaxID=2713504 RepID=UPI00164E413F|nr:Imm48 family immunity protein [Listeria portnoyi]MBC6308208.1 hypothetical protein [Listeria portnoyi]